ncbi:hypothetical protein AAG906_030921 [Vitis piasezkii]
MEAVLPVEIEMGSLRVLLEQLPAADSRSHQGINQRSQREVQTNWSGPYFIRELTPEGTAWLMDLDGNRFSEPTNVDQLKRYYIFYTCCISYMRAWVLIIGYLSLVPFHPHFSSFGCRSCYVFQEMFPRCVDLIWITEITCSMMGLHIFMELYDHPHLRDAHRGNDVFVIFARISQWSLSGAIQLGPHFSTLRCHHASPSERYFLDLWVGDSISFCPDTSGKPFLSHSVRLILSNIVVILGRSYLWHTDSHSTISVEYMSDLLRIPIELFVSHQDRLGTFDAILGHISLIQL